MFVCPLSTTKPIEERPKLAAIHLLDQVGSFNVFLLILGEREESNNI